MRKGTIVTCIECKQSKPLYAKKLCMSCYIKGRNKVYQERHKKKISENKTLDKTKLQEFYKEYWNTHEPRTCYECGQQLYKFKSWHILHIIPKRLYKNYNVDIVYNPVNIRYGCLSCHASFDNGESSTPKLITLKKQLEELWNHSN